MGLLRTSERHGALGGTAQTVLVANWRANVCQGTHLVSTAYAPCLSALPGPIIVLCHVGDDMPNKLFVAALAEICIIASVVAVVCFSISTVSCTINPEGIRIIGGEYSSPRLQEFSVEDVDSLKLVFTDQVELKELYVSAADAAIQEFAESGVSDCRLEYIMEEDQDGAEYRLTLAQDMVCGKEYVLYAVVEDAKGNSLSFSTEFSGYNALVPKVILSEVSTETRNVSGKGTRPEFIELYCLTGGNTGGMILEVFYKNGSTRYELPAAEVTAGEYITLNLRSYDDQLAGCIDETDSLSEAWAAGAVADSRDFWYPGTAKILGKTAVIVLWERRNGAMLDALLYVENSDVEGWTSTKMGDAACTAVTQEIWQGVSGVSGAFMCTGITGTRTMSRQNIPELAAEVESEWFQYPVLVSAADWLVTATSTASPGKPNSTVPYR